MIVSKSILNSQKMSWRKAVKKYHSLYLAPRFHAQPLKILNIFWDRSWNDSLMCCHAIKVIKANI